MWTTSTPGSTTMPVRRHHGSTQHMQPMHQPPCTNARPTAAHMCANRWPAPLAFCSAGDGPLAPSDEGVVENVTGARCLVSNPIPHTMPLHALGLEQAARSKLWITRESTSPRNKVSPRHALNWSSAHWQVRPRSKTLAGGSGRVATSWWYEQTALVVRHRPSALCRPHPRDPTPASAPSSPCRSPRCLKPLSVLELSSTSR